MQPIHKIAFSVHHHKTRIMRQGVRQRLAGLGANQHMNVTRADFGRLNNPYERIQWQ